MNNFDLSKLNKYQKGMIIASFIFLISIIGFLFNSRVRISESYIETPDIIIEESIDIDPEDSEPKIIISYDDAFQLVLMLAIPLVMYKIWRIVIDV